MFKIISDNVFLNVGKINNILMENASVSMDITWLTDTVKSAHKERIIITKVYHALIYVEIIHNSGMVNVIVHLDFIL